MRLNELISAKEKELAKIMRYKQSFYQDWKDGDITHSDISIRFKFADELRRIIEYIEVNSHLQV